MNDTQLNDLITWLADGARSAVRTDRFMAETCERMVASGIPLFRVGVFVRTLHPSMLGRNFIWRAGGELQIGSMAHGEDEGDEFLLSPLRQVFYHGTEVRHRINADTASNIPILTDLRAEGNTDYIALPLHMSDGETHASSWTTRHPDGFSDGQLDALRRIMPSLTRMIEIHLLRRTASGLLDNYVGARAGERILAGQIRRGHTETMQAVIWLSDLRGFTALSDRLQPEHVVDILNSYFDCQVPAILAQGGEVLKFMGDGLLAVFPVAEDEGDLTSVCGRVLEAARASRAAVAQLRWAGTNLAEEQFRFGLALHVGKVLYGNIGGGDRVDFTCIGPAVNLAARLEKIAGKLSRTVVASSAFADASAADWADLGEFPIAGFAKAERVYGLADEDLNPAGRASRTV
ncbi:adenylate/guanylate cyclase domain-containing protein [Tardiphaga alba]|uniref:Adenylate/guanylate cyclase domain-containing protein n=1 Tax=Tardiphaga alba TaxID=340268 RepID=A0ABX8ACV9_9BRAD|nr:adenylate/guanylate cyclase domain-containing protein [Tardiphaga alba]QUS41532.1 adenylate/guanylate cyclase domain-containing protein [Tardiphaga alba]